MTLDNPHDRFFKETFSRPEILADFLDVYLPSPVRSKLSIASLQRQADSYTDEQLTEHFADLIFSAQFGDQPVTITVLLEHKSYPEEHIHFQLNRYLLRVWEKQLVHKSTLTPILSIVVYHGKRKWHKRTLSTYFASYPSELLPFLPSFDYVLIDLGNIENRLPFLKTNYARLTGLLLQYSRQKRQLERVLLDHAEIISTLANTKEGQVLVETGFIYLSWTSGLTTQQIIGIFQKISSKAASTAMSAAEQLINEGIQKGIERGIQKGIEEGIEKGIRAMLKLGMSSETIAAAMELPLSTVQSIVNRI